MCLNYFSTSEDKLGNNYDKLKNTELGKGYAARNMSDVQQFTERYHLVSSMFSKNVIRHNLIYQ